MKRVDISKEQLEELYLVQELSMKKMSMVLGVGYNTVKRRIEEYGIEKRDRVETVKEAFRQKHAEIGYRLTTLSCPECQKQFQIKTASLDRSELHFCSQSCLGKHRNRLNPLSPKKGKEVHCENCGKKIYRAKNRLENAKALVCSNDCRVEWMKKEGIMAGENNPNYASFSVSCYCCGKETLRTPSKLSERNYCSVECMSLDYQRRLIGLNNPNWQGGWDNKYGPHWKRISIEVRERDGFTCQRCGRHKDELVGTEVLHAHHIIPFRLFNGDMELAHRKENLVTLCSLCHPYVEKNGIDFEWNTDGIVQPTT